MNASVKAAVVMALVMSVLFLNGTASAQDATLPAGLAGFSGQVRGVVAEKGEGFIMFRVARVIQLWKANRAENPQAIVGLTVRVQPGREGTRVNQNHVAFMNLLRVGEEVTLELRRAEEGSAFIIMELSAEQRARIGVGTTQPPVTGTANLAGFRGSVRGVVAEKGEGFIMLRVARVVNVWKANTAENPRAIINMTIRIQAGREGDRVNANHIVFINSLKAGEELTLDIRAVEEGRAFQIAELTEEQRARVRAIGLPTTDAPRTGDGVR